MAIAARGACPHWMNSNCSSQGLLSNLFGTACMAPPAIQLARDSQVRCAAFHYALHACHVSNTTPNIHTVMTHQGALLLPTPSRLHPYLSPIQQPPLLIPRPYPHPGATILTSSTSKPSCSGPSLLLAVSGAVLRLRWWLPPQRASKARQPPPASPRPR